MDAFRDVFLLNALLCRRCSGVGELCRRCQPGVKLRQYVSSCNWEVDIILTTAVVHRLVGS